MVGPAEAGRGGRAAAMGIACMPGGAGAGASGVRKVWLVTPASGPCTGAAATVHQGLTLGHFRAQLEHIREHIAHIRAQLEHLRDTSTG